MSALESKKADSISESSENTIGLIYYRDSFLQASENWRSS